jgi:hypothetical protein
MNIQTEHSSKLSLMNFTKWMMFNEVPKHPWSYQHNGTMTRLDKG